MVKIKLNGEKMTLIENISLYDLVRSNFSLKTSFAVALNGEFVTKSRHRSIIINSDDNIEVVSAHPGG